MLNDRTHLSTRVSGLGPAFSSVAFVGAVGAAVASAGGSVVVVHLLSLAEPPCRKSEISLLPKNLGYTVARVERISFGA